MRSKITGCAAAAAALFLAMSIAAAGSPRKGRAAVPRSAPVWAPAIPGLPAEVAQPLSKVLGPRVVDVPLVGLSIGKGPCGSPEHEPSAQFPLDSMKDVFFCTSWLPLEGVHLQTIEILAPDGSCYQKIETPFETPGPALRRSVGVKAQKVVLEGRKVPVEVQKLVQDPATGLSLLQAAFPVAGSYVASQAIAGSWSVNVYIDHERGPAASGAFEVTK
ncbi:MAG: hypothetical protein HY897_13785 [Deltaproteobacteria bacterium]|nr:hypothetical protein [Deltaproteobacteria bacterium]